MNPGNGEHPPRDPRQLDGLDTYPVAQVEAFVERIDELEAENKSLRDRFSDSDTERNAAQAALKAAFARVAELEALAREAEESNANAQARLSAAEATIESRRLENEAVRRQLGRAENACDAMEKRVTELEARCKRLEEAMELVAQMRQRWLEREDDGYAGAYYAFVKGKDDEWDAIMQAKEAKR